METIRPLILFLESQGFHKAAWALEQESGTSGRDLSEESQFLRGLVMEGLFVEAEEFLSPLAAGDPTPSAKKGSALFPLRRQRFLEGVYFSKSTHDLVADAEDLRNLCTPTEFKDLCYCLSLPSLLHHPEFRKWTPHRGRHECFQALDSLLREILDLKTCADEARVYSAIESSPHPAPAAVTPRKEPPARKGPPALASQNAGSAVPAPRPAPTAVAPQEQLVTRDVTVAFSEPTVILSPGCPVRTAAFSSDGDLNLSLLRLNPARSF